MKKVLVFGTYPVVRPQHGGQHRVTAIIDQYQKTGIEVRYCGVFYDAFYADKGRYDIALDGSPDDMSELEKYTTDVSAGKRIWTDSSVRKKVKKLIEDFQPDAIQIEQMFPYFGLEPLLASISWRGALIYSSHNIEYELKETILQGAECSPLEVNASVQEIKNMEITLAKKADILTSCTTSDQAVYKRLGSKSTSVLAPNGIEPPKKNLNTSDELRAEYKKAGVENIALYIGSGHPPNLVGFEEMIGYGVAFVPENARIVIVGGVSDMIWGNLQKQPNYIQIGFNKRVELLGRVSDAKLTALLEIANAVLLPITEGSGSNLKTAEAILSGRRVVATKHSFRSYERFESLSGISFADSKNSFRANITEALTAPVLKRTKQETKLAAEVDWAHALGDLTEIVRNYES